MIKVRAVEGGMVAIGTQYRQGDILLIAEGQLPAGAEPVTPEPGEQVYLAQAVRGWPKGGTHALPATRSVTTLRRPGSDGPVDWLVVEGSSVTLRHPEHAPLPVPPGIWRVVRQREYDPIGASASATRLVLD